MTNMPRASYQFRRYWTRHCAGMPGSCHREDGRITWDCMKPMVVLMIDDNSEDRSAYRRFLEPSGNYVIHEAEDGEMGLDIARRLRPNCILLSLKLKDQSGLEVLGKLMDEASLSAIPVIMISTGIAKVVIDAALSFGASHFLIKGQFDAMALDTAIRESVVKQTSR